MTVKAAPQGGVWDLNFHDPRARARERVARRARHTHGLLGFGLLAIPRPRGAPWSLGLQDTKARENEQAMSARRPPAPRARKRAARLRDQGPPLRPPPPPCPQATPGNSWDPKGPETHIPAPHKPRKARRTQQVCWSPRRHWETGFQRKSPRNTGRTTPKVIPSGTVRPRANERTLFEPQGPTETG